LKKVDIISVFIAEDEQPALELLTDYILNIPELKLGGIARDGVEAFKKLSENTYDLLFMDINLPVISGIEVLEKLESIPYVIFTTAYDQYAIKAFEMGVVDYLLKPFSSERFNQAAEKAIKAIYDKKSCLESLQQLGLSFKEHENHYILAYEDIIYLSSHARHTVIHTEKRDFETALLLKNIEQRLPENLFIRIHKQYVVNLKHVSHFQYFIGGQYVVYLLDEDKTTLPVGRSFASVLKERLII
jgi:two-component system response regulator LytT